MNKTRRTITELAKDLAQRGMASVCVDLFGTGDSEGEFAQSSWDGWIDDLASADDWTSRTHGLPVTGVVGIRLGCALAAQYAARRLRPLERWVFWQPVLDGARYMDQFLRLKLAASMLGEGQKQTVADLRREIAISGTLEVAGFELSASLLDAIDAVRLADHVDPRCPPLHWFELVRDSGAPPPVPALKLVERLHGEGRQIQLHTIASDPIWTSTEIVVSAELATATARALCP
jgi:exosortase A-associated hydrolase 2